jgi:hypothetical protein
MLVSDSQQMREELVRELGELEAEKKVLISS